MRFNGQDPCTLHEAISIAREIAPGMPKRTVHTIRGNAGDVLGGVEEERDEYIVRVNIAGQDPREAWQVRGILAAWACQGGGTLCRLVPTHREDVFYEAICEEIEPPEFKPRFATVEIRFALPRPYAISERESVVSGGTRTQMRIAGTARARPRIRITPSDDAADPAVTLDGEIIARLTGTLKAGQTAEIDYATGRVTINGSSAESRIDVSGMKWRAAFAPGVHEIAGPPGTIEARWREEWM